VEKRLTFDKRQIVPPRYNADFRVIKEELSVDG
jgi:hypothetical protein